MQQMDHGTIRQFAGDLERVWGEWADSDIIELTREAKAVLDKLADRIQPMADPTAWGRPETDPCERGTVGCSVRHPATGPEISCEVW